MGEISEFNFRDETDRVWDMRVTGSTVKRVKNLLGVNILDITNFTDKNPNSVRVRYAVDPCFMVDVLWAVCMPQALTAGVTDEQFGELLAGDVLEHASNALVEAVINFTPNPAVRAAMKGMLGAVKTAAGEVERGMMEMAEKMQSPEVMESARVMVKKHFASLSSAAASSESTPTE